MNFEELYLKSFGKPTANELKLIEENKTKQEKREFERRRIEYSKLLFQNYDVKRSIIMGGFISREFKEELQMNWITIWNKIIELKLVLEDPKSRRFRWNIPKEVLSKNSKIS